MRDTQSFLSSHSTVLHQKGTLAIESGEGVKICQNCRRILLKKLDKNWT